MAEQLISTKACSPLGLRSWIARAASSFPVPVAPVIRTEASVGATRSMTEKSFLITGDWPMRVGVLEPLILRPSCLSAAIALVRAWLLVDQPSIAVGVIRGIQLTNSFGLCPCQELRLKSVSQGKKAGSFLAKLDLENTERRRCSES